MDLKGESECVSPELWNHVTWEFTALSVRLGLVGINEAKGLFLCISLDVVGDYLYN